MPALAGNRCDCVISLAGDDPAAIIPALDRIRDRFLATGRKIDAAWVSLDVVMLLRDADRHEEAIRLAISLFEFFMHTASRRKPCAL
jgi:hypothetical protein